MFCPRIRNNHARQLVDHRGLMRVSRRLARISRRSTHRFTIVVEIAVGVLQEQARCELDPRRHGGRKNQRGRSDLQARQPIHATRHPQSKECGQ